LGIPVYEHVPSLRQAAEAMVKELDAVLMKDVVE
jgi:hypothetical protein